MTSLTDSSGTVDATYRYDAYGNLVATTGTVPNPYRFTGREYDTATGFQYNRARYYDPVTGRFLTPDPAGCGCRCQGSSAYAYAGGDPVGRTDPTGLFVVSSHLFDGGGGDFWSDMEMGFPTSAEAGYPQYPPSGWVGLPGNWEPARPPGLSRCDACKETFDHLCEGGWAGIGWSLGLCGSLCSETTVGIAVCVPVCELVLFFVGYYGCGSSADVFCDNLGYCSQGAT